MKPAIHPEYMVCNVRCLGCNTEFQTRSTKPTLTVEICSSCHGFYTGKQKLVDTAGRVERFAKRYGAKAGNRRASAPEAE
jgi:large subunit ribosomal protein L31